MNMIEKVARAIGCIDADRCQYTNSNSKENQAKIGSCKECLQAGRDAIEAMRDYYDNEFASFEASDVPTNDIPSLYQMIDAALKEE